MKKYVFAILVIAALSLALSGCGSVSVSVNPSSSPTAGTTGSGGTPNFGVQTKTSGCKAHNGLQDSACTPGAILSTGTKTLFVSRDTRRVYVMCRIARRTRSMLSMGSQATRLVNMRLTILRAWNWAAQMRLRIFGRSLPAQSRASMRKIRSKIICMTRFVRGRFLCNRPRWRLRRTG